MGGNPALLVVPVIFSLIGFIWILTAFGVVVEQTGQLMQRWQRVHKCTLGTEAAPAPSPLLCLLRARDSGRSASPAPRTLTLSLSFSPHSRVVVRGHTLVLGWTDKTAFLLGELAQVRLIEIDRD